MQTSFEKQRRGRGVPSVQNMGSIYWQFQANWQSATWATIDYSGNWKISHNFVKNIFADLLITSYFTGGNLNVWVVNDYLENIPDVSVKVQLFKFDQITNIPAKELTFPNLQIKSASSQEIASLQLSNLFDASCP